MAFLDFLWRLIVFLILAGWAFVSWWEVADTMRHSKAFDAVFAVVWTVLAGVAFYSVVVTIVALFD